MAGASSSPRAVVDDEQGYASGYVQPRTDCPHLADIQLNHYPSLDTCCCRCESAKENWVCLTCKIVACGRYVNQHMLAHSVLTNHPVALSHSDLSIWCFKCDAYLDAQAIPQLQRVFGLLYRMKFGEEPPLASVGCSAGGSGSDLEKGASPA